MPIKIFFLAVHKVDHSLCAVRPVKVSGEQDWVGLKDVKHLL